MTCKYGPLANGRERERTLPTLAMQKAVGSSPIIRFKNPCYGVLSSVQQTAASAWFTPVGLAYCGCAPTVRTIMRACYTVRALIELVTA